MKVTAPFIWDQHLPGCWSLSLQLGQVGRATVEMVVPNRKWRWSIRGFADREPAEGTGRTREEAMMAAQRAILTKSGRLAPTKRQETLVTA